MNAYSLSHLGDASLLKAGAGLVSNERSNTALLLAHIAEIDARKLYLPAAYSSMYAYCVGEWKLSDDSARKRIHAARSARQFPMLFGAIADGRLNVSGVVLLAPHLSQANAKELIAAASHRSKAEIEVLLAERDPRPSIPTRIAAVIDAASVETLSEQRAPGRVSLSETELLTMDTPARVAPLSPERYALQCTLRKQTHDLLRQAQELMSHELPTGDVDAVLHRALTCLVAQLEKRKFAATSRPHRTPRPTRSARQIPAAVKRAVWQRDGGQCTFASETGRRCEARRRLEFDHEMEVARGGESTVDNVRLRCRAHNQFGAERTFGAGFMAEKREAARRERVDPENDVTPWLRQLGFNASEAKLAAQHCATLPDCSLEACVKQAIAYLRPRRGTMYVSAPPSAATLSQAASVPAMSDGSAMPSAATALSTLPTPSPCSSPPAPSPASAG